MQSGVNAGLHIPGWPNHGFHKRTLQSAESVARLHVTAGTFFNFVIERQPWTKNQRYKVENMVLLTVTAANIYSSTSDPYCILYRR
jgi:hypothetical protein